MAITSVKTGTIRSPKAPNLLIAPTEYAQAYQDQMNNALRLYFNQIDNFTQAIAIPDSGAKTQRPVVNLQVGQQFFDTTLVLPIWWTGTKWINASGTAV
jgi:hypothetical protein